MGRRGVLPTLNPKAKIAQGERKYKSSERDSTSATLKPDGAVLQCVAVAAQAASAIVGIAAARGVLVRERPIADHRGGRRRAPDEQPWKVCPATRHRQDDAASGGRLEHRIDVPQDARQELQVLADHRLGGV